MNDARKRALRAARVTTLGLVLAAPGCYASHGEVAEAPPVREDAALILEDAGQDAALADAGICDVGDGWGECCERIGWDWERGCAAWGPFVPPADGEVA